MPTDELGKIAFEAYCRSAVKAPAWTVLNEEQQQGWRDAAEAVLDHHLQKMSLHQIPVPARLDD
jgi:hypothetical protein